MKKRIAIIAALLLLVVGTAYGTYRYTMRHIKVSISEDTARLTVYGQSDDYDFDIISMNPTKY